MGVVIYFVMRSLLPSFLGLSSSNGRGVLQAVADGAGADAGGARPVAAPRGPAAAAAAIASWRRETNTWKFIAIAAVLSQMVSIPAVVYMMRSSREVVIADAAGNYVLAPTEDLERANSVIEDCARNAVLAFWMRGPEALELPLLGSKIFDSRTWGEVQQDLGTRREEAVLKSLHIKPEIERVTVTRADGKLIAVVTGQLIQVGTFRGQPIYDTPEFEMAFALTPNPDLRNNGRYPFVVTQYRIRKPL